MATVGGEQVPNRHPSRPPQAMAVPLVEVPLVGSGWSVEPHCMVEAGPHEPVMVLFLWDLEGMDASGRAELDRVRSEGQTAHMEGWIVGERIDKPDPTHRAAGTGMADHRPPFHDPLPVVGLWFHLLRIGSQGHTGRLDLGIVFLDLE